MKSFSAPLPRNAYFSSFMKILITGATGFIGSHIAESLHAKGYSLRCLIRKTSDLKWIKHLPIEYVYGDLFESEALKSAVKDVDYVYHLAGTTKSKSRAGYFQGNHIGTKNLLDAVLAVKPNLKRFVHVSSLAAVGPGTIGHPVDENTPYHPITAYGESKMESEKECLRVAEKIPITITRPPAVYGPRDKDVFAFFQTMSKGLQPMIGFNDKQVSLIHVKDLANGIILAGEHPKGVGQAYFVSSERFYTWKEVGEATAKVIGRKAIRLRVPVALVYMIAGISEVWSMITQKAVLLNYEKARDIVQDAWTCSIAKTKADVGYSEGFT